MTISIYFMINGGIKLWPGRRLWDGSKWFLVFDSERFPALRNAFSIGGIKIILMPVAERVLVLVVLRSEYFQLFTRHRIEVRVLAAHCWYLAIGQPQFIPIDYQLLLHEHIVAQIVLHSSAAGE